MMATRVASIHVPSFSRASRREFLRIGAAGVGGLAAQVLLGESSQRADGPLVPRQPPFAARAKRVIMLFMFGGPSHVDTFDPKPLLSRDSGRPLPFAGPRVVSFKERQGNLVGSPFRFERRGECGLAVSELFPHVAEIADDLCVIRSMHCGNSRHGGAVLEWHTGSDTSVRPSMGSWITYGLGSESRELPGYITICQALSQGGANNFGSAFLPAAFQGTPLGHGDLPAREAKFPFTGEGPRPLARRRLELDMLAEVGERHAKRLGGDSELEARLDSFELAFRMQMAAPLAMDLNQETQATHRAYGIDDPATEDFGRQCLLARRFSERGVRFTQCNSNGWDHHTDLERNMRVMCRGVDRPIAALIRDLKSRGLLDETLVIWGGEFGRTPVAENENGRDHNPHGFTMWMAGGGVRPGLIYGQTDDYGYYAVENKVHFHDLHATILWLLGWDHRRLVYRHAGRDFRLTDVHGEVVTDLLA